MHIYIFISFSGSPAFSIPGRALDSAGLVMLCTRWKSALVCTPIVHPRACARSSSESKPAVQNRGLHLQR